MEEELPVDVVDELRNRDIDLARAGERRPRQVVEREHCAVRARLGQREQRPLQLLRVLTAKPLLELAVLDVEGCSAGGIEQAGDDVDDAACVEDVDRLGGVLGSDLHRRVLAGGCRAADQEW